MQQLRLLLPCECSFGRAVESMAQGLVLLLFLAMHVAICRGTMPGLTNRRKKAHRSGLFCGVRLNIGRVIRTKSEYSNSEKKKPAFWAGSLINIGAVRHGSSKAGLGCPDDMFPSAYGTNHT